MSLGREAKLRNQQWVLITTGYTLFNQARHAPLLLTKAEKLCRLSVNPVFIFRELLIEIAQHKITRPGYSTFQKIISSSLASEQKRINLIFKDHLSAQDQNQLFNLLDREEHFYAITLLKHQPKNFKPTAIRQEIEKGLLSLTALDNENTSVTKEAVDDYIHHLVDTEISSQSKIIEKSANKIQFWYKRTRDENKVLAMIEDKETSGLVNSILSRRA